MVKWIFIAHSFICKSQVEDKIQYVQYFIVTEVLCFSCLVLLIFEGAQMTLR